MAMHIVQIGLQEIKQVHIESIKSNKTVASVYSECVHLNGVLIKKGVDVSGKLSE